MASLLLPIGYLRGGHTTGPCSLSSALFMPPFLFSLSIYPNSYPLFIYYLNTNPLSSRQIGAISFLVDHSLLL